MAGLTNKALFLPGLRARMGDWTYYITVMKLKDIRERIGFAKDIHKSKRLNELIQRELEPRGAKIADYLLKQQQRLFNSIIVGVYGGEPQWLELSLEGPTIQINALEHS